VRILHNPTYAGTYVYGQCEYDPFDRSPSTGKARPHGRPPEDWPSVHLSPSGRWLAVSAHVTRL